jgi:hypothetical protein
MARTALWRRSTRRWLLRRLRRQSDLIARQDKIGVPTAIGASIEVENAVLATGIELPVVGVKLREGNAVVCCNVPQRIAGLDSHGHSIGIAICPA